MAASYPSDGSATSFHFMNRDVGPSGFLRDYGAGASRLGRLGGFGFPVIAIHAASAGHDLDQRGVGQWQRPGAPVIVVGVPRWFPFTRRWAIADVPTLATGMLAVSE